MILIDDVRTCDADGVSVKDLRRLLAWVLHSEHGFGVGQTRDHGGLQCALKINDSLITILANFAQHGQNCRSSLGQKWRPAPTFGVNDVYRVNQRARAVARARSQSVFRAEQFGPTLLENPADRHCGEGASQRGDSGSCVDHISHGAQAHNQQALRRNNQTAHELRFSSRLRMMSVAE